MALTEQKRIFLDTYIDAVDGGVKPRDALSIAKETAGYSKNTAMRDIINDDMSAEMLAHANRHLMLNIPSALNKLDSLMENPEQGGAAVLLNTLNSFLDRSGVIKKEAKEVTIKSPTGIVFLPAKGILDPE